MLHKKPRTTLLEKVRAYSLAKYINLALAAGGLAFSGCQGSKEEEKVENEAENVAPCGENLSPKVEEGVCYYDGHCSTEIVCYNNYCHEEEICLGRKCAPPSCHSERGYFELDGKCCTRGAGENIFCITDSLPAINDYPLDLNVDDTQELTVLDKRGQWTDRIDEKRMRLTYYGPQHLIGEERIISHSSCLISVVKDANTFWAIDPDEQKIGHYNSDWNLIGSFPFPGDSPRTLALGERKNSDGEQTLWYLDAVDGLSEMDLEGAVLRRIVLPAPRDFALEGSNIWYVNTETNYIYGISHSGRVYGEFPSPGTAPEGIAVSNKSIWLVDGQDLRLYKLENIIPVIPSCYADSDDDRWGNKDNPIQPRKDACPVGSVRNPYDCNDANVNIRPGAVEICDGLDNNCNGQIDENIAGVKCGSVCGKGQEICVDGKMICYVEFPNAETCNGLDDNCDGAIDEGLTKLCHSICGEGVATCSEGRWGECDAPTECCEPGEIKDITECPNSPYSFVFVIDNSGSMGGNDPQDYRYSGLVQLIDLMKNNDDASIIAFASNFNSYCEEFPSDKTELKNCIEEAERFGGGGTNIDPAMYQAIENISSRVSQKAIILLTDGDDGGFYPAQDIRNKAEQMGIAIYALGLGSVDANALRTTATASGGYFHIEQPEDIPTIYEQIFREVRRESWLECGENRQWDQKFSGC